MLSQISVEQEHQLVERAQSGDDAALAELVEPLRQPLFSYVYRMVTMRQDAEDLLQDVLVRVLENINKFRGEARFKTWLFGIATHVCMDHRARRSDGGSKRSCKGSTKPKRIRTRLKGSSLCFTLPISSSRCESTSLSAFRA